MDIVIGIIGLAIGAIVAWYLTGKAANSRAQSILSDAEKDAAVIKKKMLLEAKEETLSMQNEAEKQANSRLSKIQMTENRLKQREMTLNQKQEELNKKTLDIDEARVTLASQQEFMDKKAAEMERLHRQSVEKLETISGLSAQEAKERLVESLRDEAKTDAQSYVNDIMEEAKMTANKEAKKIVIQSIQRVATETSIENAITVFHIDSDEVKGRIIGREGRNIRALEAATGVEIVVDDTPEAIVLSGFDPVRREIARLSLHQLVADGRIHPARIEEVVSKVKKQIEEEIIETGKRT